jgi:uncharacterized protein
MSNPMTRILLWLFLISALPLQAAIDFPPLTGRVVDQAGILDDASRKRLNTLLLQHEQATGNQLVVTTLKSLQGHTIEEYGYRLGRHWGLGQEGENNGALLIVAPHEHKVRIEVGYGLEARLTDARAHDIIQTAILPPIREQGDYNQGVRQGVEAILTTLANKDMGKVTPHTPPAVNPSAPLMDGSMENNLAMLLLIATFGMVLFGKLFRTVFVRLMVVRGATISLLAGGVALFAATPLWAALIAGGLYALTHIFRRLHHYDGSGAEFYAKRDRTRQNDPCPYPDDDITSVDSSPAAVAEEFSGDGGDFGGGGASGDE